MGMSIVELVLLGSILAIMIAVAISIVALGRRASNPRQSPLASPSHEMTQLEAVAVAAQLGEADRLLDEGHISQAEYASLRARLLGIERSPDR